MIKFVSVNYLFGAKNIFKQNSRENETKFPSTSYFKKKRKIKLRKRGRRGGYFVADLRSHIFGLFSEVRQVIYRNYCIEMLCAQ